jgi:hypothetical protein
MPAGWDGPIVIKGLMLMEMPATVVDKRKKAEHREAIQQVLNSEAALREAPNGTAPRDHPALDKAGLNKAKREMMQPVADPDRVRTRGV